MQDTALNAETLAGLDQLAAYNQHDDPLEEQTVDLMYGDSPEFQVDTSGLMHAATTEPSQPSESMFIPASSPMSEEVLTSR